MPRLEDGSANLREPMRRIAEDVVNAVTGAGADQLCAGGANSRNGYRERNLVTRVGDITMRIPKLRSGSFFPEDVVERYQRVDRAVASAVAEMYATGTSTRKVQRIAEKLRVSRLSKDQVGAIAKDLDAEVAEEAEPDALACLAFPPAHWRRLRTNNVQERANREIKRRSRVVQVFPSERSLERLVGAVMCEQDERWSASRHFAYDKMQELYDERRRKEPEAPGRPAADLAEAARKMILASLELAEKVDAAQHGRLDSGFGRRPKPLAVPIRRSLGLPSAVPSENGLHQHSRHHLEQPPAHPLHPGHPSQISESETTRHQVTCNSLNLKPPRFHYCPPFPSGKTNTRILMRQ